MGDYLADSVGCGRVGTGGAGADGCCGRGCLNSLDQTGHPKIAHRILELLAIYVTFELFGVFLNPGSPIVLDFVISPPG